MKCEFYERPFLKCIATEAIVSAGIAAGGAVAQGVASGRMNARASRLAHRQHEWAVQDAKDAREWTEKMYNDANQWNLDQWNRENQWNLDQWNRQNEYDSASAQMQRWRDAGLNPLAFNLQGGNNPMQAGSVSASVPASSQASLGSLPQFHNPLEGLSDSYLQFKKYQLESKQIDSQIRKSNEEADSIRQQSIFRSLLFKNELDFAGTRIKVNEQSIRESKERVNLYAQQAAELNSKMALNIKYIDNVASDTAWKDFQRFAARQKLDPETQAIIENVLSTRVQRFGHRQDNINKWYEGERLKDLYGDKFGDWKEPTYHQRELTFRDSENNSRALQSIGATKTPFLYSIDKAMDSIQKTVDVFTSFCQGLAKTGVGGRATKSPVSTSNPTSNPYEPNTSTVRYGYGGREYNRPSGW